MPLVTQQHLLQDGLEDQFKSKAGKSFKANYMEFWDKVMRECQSTDILFDNYLLEKVSFLVIALSWWGLLPSLLYIAPIHAPCWTLSQERCALVTAASWSTPYAVSMMPPSVHNNPHCGSMGIADHHRCSKKETHLIACHVYAPTYLKPPATQFKAQQCFCCAALWCGTSGMQLQ